MALNSEVFTRGPSLLGLKRLHLFFDLVLGRMQSILNLPQDWNPSQNEPEPELRSPDMIPQGLSSASETVKKKRVQSGSFVGVPPVIKLDYENENLRLNNHNRAEEEIPHFFITKSEAEREVCLFNFINKYASRLFARNYSIVINEAVREQTFEFERMLPMFDSSRKDFYLPSPELFPSTASTKLRLLIGIKFSLDTLVGLNFLHFNLGVLHTDICPRNIMYSFVDECWKLIDFKLVTKMEDALKFDLDHGSPYFKAPEVEHNYRHSTASDVYALGSVFLNVLERALPRNSSLLFKAPELDAFYRLSRKMTAQDPQSRPSVQDCIKIVLKAFKLLAPDYQDFVLRAAEEAVNERIIFPKEDSKSEPVSEKESVDKEGPADSEKDSVIEEGPAESEKESVDTGKESIIEEEPVDVENASIFDVNKPIDEKEPVHTSQA